MISDGKYSFQKFTQFSQVNNVLDILASNIDGFLTRDIVLLLFTWKKVFCTKVMFFTLENLVR
jgi:hypothetical protein